jgi:hypothetical protein
MFLERVFHSNNKNQAETMPRDDGDFLSSEIATEGTQPFPVPSARNDFLLSDDYNPVESIDWQHGKRDEVDGVVFDTLSIQMGDGTRHVGSFTRLPHHKRRSNITHLGATAWTTGLEGMNKAEQLILAKRYGVESIIVKPQQNLTRIGRLSRSAHNLLEIGMYAAPHFYRDPKQFTVGGKSRGGMTTYTATALAELHDVNVLYGDYIALCFRNGLKRPSDVGVTAKKLSNEIGGIGEIASLPLRTLLHYRKTLELAPRDVFQQFKEVPGLLNGEIGSISEARLSPNAFGYVYLEEGDGLSRTKEWEEKITYDSYPHMIMDVRAGGSHLGACAGPDSKAAYLNRMDTIMPLIAREEDTLRRLGAQAGMYLHVGAALENPAFNPVDKPGEEYSSVA